MAANWTGDATEPESSKNIDGVNYKVITTASELAWFAYQINSGVAINGVLAANITLGTTYAWTPIGKDSTHMFNTIFDGANYTITTPYMTTGDFAGLFGVINTAGVVKNVKIASPNITHTRNGGAVAGFNNGTIDKVTVTGGTVNTTTDAAFSGGMVGRNNGTISNSTTGVAVSNKNSEIGAATTSYAGGVTGYNLGKGVISGTTISGSVYSYSHINNAYAGGAAAYNAGSIKTTKNTASVKDSIFDYYTTSDHANLFTGGLAGYNTGTIENTVNSGEVYSGNKQYRANLYDGGIAGYNAGTISKSENTAKLSSVLWGTGVYDLRYNTSYLGGVAAYNTGKILDSKNSGTATYTKKSTTYSFTGYSGGIVGVNTGSNALVQNSFSITNSVTAETAKGGVAGVNESSAKIINSYYDQTVLSSVSAPVGTQSATLTNSGGKTTTDMKKDQFAWILNTTNGTATNSKVWSRYDGYPIFVTSAYKPIVKVVFNDNGATTNKYSAYTGKVTFPSDPEPPTGYIFDGWYNSSNTKVSSSTVFSADQTVTSKNIDTTVKYTIKFYNSDSTTVLSTQTVGYGVTPTYSGSTPTKASTAQYLYTFSKWNPTLAAAYSNANYYATYTSTVRSYTITFNDYNGTKLQSSSVKYGAIPSYSSTPTRASTAEWKYTFKGWSPTIQSVTGAATYKATYDSSKVKYTIAFKNYDGTQLSAASFDYGATPSYSGTPTRASTAKYTYTFKGWNPGLSTVTGVATYTALYDSTIVNYKIDFVDYNGASIQSNTLAYGSTPTKPSNPSRSSTAEWTFSFKGWDPSVTTVSGDATYMAVYDSSVAEYDISFKDYDGSIIQSSKLLYGETPIAPANPNRKATAEWSYVFKDWDKEITAVTGEAEYVALYDSTKNSYQVTFVDYDGTYIESLTLEYGDEPECSMSPSRRSSAMWNYAFKGWNPAISRVTGEITYKAVYDSSKVEYKISLISDGFVVQSENVAYGEVFSIPRGITKDGFTFVGWYLGDDLLGNVGDVIVVTQEIVAEARYSINSYMVKFIDFDGSILKKESYEYGSIPAYGKLLSREASAEWNYEFIGWSPAIGKVVKAVNYMAQYDSSKVKYEVVFMNGVEEFDSQDVEYGASAKYPASTPRKKGFQFVGWNKDFSHVTTDLIVEAMFEEITSSSSKEPGNSSESGNSGEENKESILARPNSHLSVNTISHSIQISGAIIGSRLSLLDMQGRVLKQEYVNSSNFVISVQHSGSYILRVGNQSLRVVIK